MKALVASLRFACSAVLLLLVLCVLWGWITREFGAQARWSEELARLLLVWISLLGAALAYADGAHLGIDLVTRRWDASTARLAALFSHAVTGVFAVVILGYGGGLLAWQRWQSGQLLAALQIPKAWMYLAAPVSGLAFALLAAAFLRSVWRDGVVPAAADTKEVL